MGAAALDPSRRSIAPERLTKGNARTECASLDRRFRDGVKRTADAPVELLEKLPREATFGGSLSLSDSSFDTPPARSNDDSAGDREVIFKCEMSIESQLPCLRRRHGAGIISTGAGLVVQYLARLEIDVIRSTKEQSIA
jgi:hypothetical protein